MPASYVDGEFTSCEGELQDVIGTYTSNGQSEFPDFSVVSFRVYSRMTNYTSPDMVATRFAGPIHNTSLDTANSCVLQLCNLLFSATLWWQHSFCGCHFSHISTSRIPNHTASTGIWVSSHRQQRIRHRNSSWQLFHKRCRTVGRQLSIVRIAGRGSCVLVKRLRCF